MRQSWPSITISGTRIDLSYSADVYRFIDRVIGQNRRGERIFFVNAHCVNVAQSDAEYRDILQRASLVLNDGIGVSLAARLQKVAFKENMCGTDFIPRLLVHAAGMGYRVFLLGARPGVAEAAGSRLLASIPSLRIVGTCTGHLSVIENEKVLERIRALNVDILIVGMGVPLQEKWIARHAGASGARVLLGVGAFLDFASGHAPRAPRVLRWLRLEWLYRLLIEPRRLAKRYLLGNPLFLSRLITDPLRGRRHAAAEVREEEPE